MKNAENNQRVGRLQRDKLEAKEYIGTQSNHLGEQKNKYDEFLTPLLVD